jgi:2-C-methyl-D-erythritol 4-phosphate cytidylyltransferase
LDVSFTEASARAAAIIVAAGSGRRFGGSQPKQYLALRGEPILAHAVRPFVEHPGIAAVVVVLPPGDAADPPAWLRGLGVSIAAGGAERGNSVWNGLVAAPEEADPLLIHDGARPFVSREVISRVLDAARTGAAIAGLPATDTIKEVGIDGVVRGTPDRSLLWQAQTPQGFPRQVIFDAYRRAREMKISGTDDAALCESAGAAVSMVLGAPENIKVTRPFDLIVAEALASRLL